MQLCDAHKIQTLSLLLQQQSARTSFRVTIYYIYLYTQILRDIYLRGN